jgi:hypothetical protein
MKSLLIPLLFATTASFAQIAGQATPVDKIKVAKGFKVELLYSVPKETEGSWVAMTQDDKGRMICSDQYGALYRITPPAMAAVRGNKDREAQHRLRSLPGPALSCRSAVRRGE